MNTGKRLRVLIVATHVDKEEVGETWNAYKWVHGLAEECELMLLTQYRGDQQLPSLQLPHVKVIEWEEPNWYRRFKRFDKINSILKPWYISFYIQARKQIKQLLANGEHFDIIHQLTPIAIRYPTPCSGFGIPFIVGPLSGGLQTPPAFKKELSSAPWYMHLRLLDQIRLRYDPLMRRTYEHAAVVLGAAPYIKDILNQVRLQRFEVECEVGIDEVETVEIQLQGEPNQVRLLFVGRLVRTKGLRDLIRAVAKLQDMKEISLTVAGDGEELELCRQEATDLGIMSHIDFRGRVSRKEVERLYSEADIFVFPSFREPTGGVVLEAMRHGLPIITANYGGPAYLATETCGIRVPVLNPQQFACDIATAIRSLANDPIRMKALGEGAHNRVKEVGLWENKIKRMVKLYQEIS